MDTNSPDLPPLFSPTRDTKNLPIRLLYGFVGILLVFVGMIWWILPFLPGVPLILAGLAIIGLCSNSFSGWVNRCEAKLPKRYRILLRPKIRKQMTCSKSKKIIQQFFNH
jgi:uncharacterized membrane protein YbaN (DUF454 family)